MESFSDNVNLKFTLEQYFRSTESFEHEWITASFIAVVIEIASLITMNSSRNDDPMCDLSCSKIGKTVRLSERTVRRELNKACSVGMFEKTGTTWDGRLIIEAGKWFKDRQSAGKVVNKRRAVDKCGTVSNPVYNSPPPGHSDLPPPDMVTAPPGHNGRHITNALTNSFTKPLVAQQGVNNMNKLEKQSEPPEPKPEPQPYSGLLKKPSYLTNSNEHCKTAMQIMSEKLGRPLNYRT